MRASKFVTNPMETTHRNVDSGDAKMQTKTNNWVGARGKLDQMCHERDGNGRPKEGVWGNEHAKKTSNVVGPRGKFVTKVMESITFVTNL